MHVRNKMLIYQQKKAKSKIGAASALEEREKHTWFETSCIPPIK